MVEIQIVFYRTLGGQPRKKEAEWEEYEFGALHSERRKKERKKVRKRRKEVKKGVNKGILMQ